MTLNGRDGVLIAIPPFVGKEEQKKREREAAERAVIFAAKIKATKDDGKLPKVVKVE